MSFELENPPLSGSYRGSVWTRLGLIALATLAAPSCSRNFYRTQADQEASYVVGQVSSLTDVPMEYFDVYTDPRSRLFDPTTPDAPPMPPDDPAAHKLMKSVNYMPGYLRWYANGCVPAVDLRDWEQYLPAATEGGGIPLDLPTAVMLARMHSRDYQQQLETFYLAALDVTFERFRFTAQWFGTNDTTYATHGPAAPGAFGQSSSTLSVVNDIQRQKLFGAGGQLLVEFANSFVWQFAGPNTQTANSLASFNFMQPLLRGAGRARVMERLTLAERTLLYDVRQMEQYRRAFFAQVATGRGAAAGPQRLGGVFGTSGLTGFTGVGGGGFGQVGTAVASTAGGGIGGGGTGAGAAQAQGYIGVLQDIMQIRNQEANVAGLRDSVAQLQSAYEAGRIDRFQVDLTRQSLYTNESQVLNAKATMENLLDSLKLTMGLPPDVNFVLQDPFLDRFKLLDPELTAIQNHVDDAIDKIRNPPAPMTEADLRTHISDMGRIRAEIAGHLKTVAEDFTKLDTALPGRGRNLKRLQLRPEYDRGDVEPDAYSVNLLEERVETLNDDRQELINRVAANWEALDRFSQRTGEIKLEEARLALLEIVTNLSGQVLELSLLQARARLDAIELVPIQILPSQALAIASAKRFDWKNQRAAVIDTWRRIEFNANDMMSGLNVVFSGDLGTTRDNPIDFRGTTGNLSVGVQFDAPLTRVNERNVYRQSLIDYQQSRRRYMLFIDTIHQTLRQEIRQINLNQINFELNRAAVTVAIEKVDLARLKLMQPPAPGATAGFSDTFARDLTQALNDLLQAQNDFMSVWVNYEVQRIQLDYDLGVMNLDDRGMWIDPGPVDGTKLLAESSEDCMPEDLPFVREAEQDGAELEKELTDGKTPEERKEEDLPPANPHNADEVRLERRAPGLPEAAGPRLEPAPVSADRARSTAQAPILSTGGSPARLDESSANRRQSRRRLAFDEPEEAELPTLNPPERR
ncbi:MAG TPA: TolC family protein [Pirellulales bacterium]